MGCDIHAYAEIKAAVGWQEKTPDEFFDLRNYGIFGFLADVRNYSDVTPLAAPKGLPADMSLAVREKADEWECDAHSHSWFKLSELLAVDYDQTIEDRRVTRNGNGGCTAEPGGGQSMTLREFLGSSYFKQLDKMAALAESPDHVRLIFWFDN